MTEAFDARWTNLPLIGYYVLPTSYGLRKRIHRFHDRFRNVLSKVMSVSTGFFQWKMLKIFIFFLTDY